MYTQAKSLVTNKEKVMEFLVDKGFITPKYSLSTLANQYLNNYKKCISEVDLVDELYHAIEGYSDLVLNFDSYSKDVFDLIDDVIEQRERRTEVPDFLRDEILPPDKSVALILSIAGVVEDMSEVDSFIDNIMLGKTDEEREDIIKLLEVYLKFRFYGSLFTYKGNKGLSRLLAEAIEACKDIKEVSLCLEL